MRVTKRFIDRVRRETDLVALIRENVSLVRCGRVLRAACPFCESDSDLEELEVHPSEGFFWAACCNREGDAFTWVMMNHNMTLDEAAPFCAARFETRLAA